MDDQGIDHLARERVRLRLGELLRLQMRSLNAIEQAADVLSHHPEAAEVVSHIGATLSADRQALGARFAALGGAFEVGAAVSADSRATASDAVREIAAMAAELALGYETAYQTGRLMYDRETCDLLESLLAGAVAALVAARGALPHVVARELRDAGAPCACQCPMCSLGLCGCVRATLSAVSSAWTGHELDSERGLSLLTPPRPDSQLAEAGLVEGDRIVTIDGVEVGSNAEVQAALRRRDIGQQVRLDVERETWAKLEATVRRVR